MRPYRHKCRYLNLLVYKPCIFMCREVPLRPVATALLRRRTTYTAVVYIHDRQSGNLNPCPGNSSFHRSIIGGRPFCRRVRDSQVGYRQAFWSQKPTVEGFRHIHPGHGCTSARDIATSTQDMVGSRRHTTMLHTERCCSMFVCLAIWHTAVSRNLA